MDCIEQTLLMILQKLLIIDDDYDCTNLIKFVLEQDTNWQILTATKAEKGVGIAETEQPDIILLDLIMSDFDGLEIYRMLRSNPNTCSIPIILMTAMVPILPLLDKRITEDIEIITKPFDVSNLAKQITEIYDRYHLFVMFLGFSSNFLQIVQLATN